MVAKRKIAFNQENTNNSLSSTQDHCMPKMSKTVRRNARERNRVKQIDVGFEKLRTTIPTAANQKKISRVKILASAVDYIQHLHNLISDHESVCVRGGVGTIIKQEPMSQASSSLPSTPKSLTSSPGQMMAGHQYQGYPPYPHMNQNYPHHYSPLTPHSPMSPMSGYPSPMTSSQWTPHSDPGYYSGHSPALTPRSTNTCHVPRRVQASHPRDSLSPGSQYSDSGFMSPVSAPVTSHTPSLTQDPTPSTTYHDDDHHDELLDAIVGWEGN